MKFLELHLSDGKPLLVNLENVSIVCADDCYESTKACINFNGGSEDWVRVIESYDDIVNAIKKYF